MTEEQKKHRALYMRLYRRANKERVADIQKRSYLKHHEARLDDAKKQREKQREINRRLNEWMN